MRMPTMVKPFLPIGLRSLGNSRSDLARNIAGEIDDKDSLEARIELRGKCA